MTYKNTKTILFASLIVAMILPFSGMQSANADHYGNGVEHENANESYYYEAYQQRLVDKLAIVEDRIAYGIPDDRVQEQLELVKQTILAKLLERSFEYNGAGELTGPLTLDSAVTNTNLSIEGVHVGCDDVIESWYFNGVMTNGDGMVSISQDFPTRFTSGTSPDCAISLWATTVHLEIQPAFLGVGCQGNLDTAPTSEYGVNCQTDISGLWIVGITFDYRGYTETKYTYVDV